MSCISPDAVHEQEILVGMWRMTAEALFAAIGH
jgi:hypothetical protein